MGNAQTGQQVQGVLAELRVLEQRVASAHAAQRHELEAVTAQLAQAQAQTQAQTHATLAPTRTEAAATGRLLGACARFGNAKVLVGPVVGLVTETSARVLLEVDQDAELECHVCILDAMNPGGREIQRVRQWFSARVPAVFQIIDLDPGLRYHFVFSGLRRTDALERTGTLRTMQRQQALEIAAVYGNAAASASPEEMRKLWGALWRRADADNLDVLLHLGGQVDLRSKFTRCAVMLSHLTDRESMPMGSVDEAEIARIEACVCDEFRQVYRDTWSHPEVRRVLAATSNLMIWSDLEASPSPRRNTKVFAMIDEAYPPRLLALAQRVYREYQRALWDPSETSSTSVPWGVNGSGNEETFLAALTDESAVLFIDSRASQFSPDGTSTPWPVGPLVSPQQWQQITALLRHHVRLKSLIVVTDRPVVPFGAQYENADEGYDEWTVNAKEQAILLNLLFSWRANADIVLVCGAGPLARPARTLLTNETTERAALVQVTVPPIAGRCYDTSLLSAFRAVPSTGNIALKRVLRDEPSDAFQLEPLASVSFRHQETVSDEDLAGEKDVHDPGFAVVGISSDVVRASFVRAAADGRQQPSLLLGPILGQITHESAVVLIEVSEACSLVCSAHDELTGEKIYVKLPIAHARRACRFCFRGSLRPDRQYTFRVDGLDRQALARGRTMPAPEHVALGAETEVAVFAFYRNALTNPGGSAWLDACHARARVDPQVTPGVALHLGGQVDLHFAQSELEWAVRGIAKAQPPLDASAEIVHETRAAIEEAIRGVYRSLWNLADLATVFSTLGNIMCVTSLDVEPPRNFAEDPDLIPWYGIVRDLALEVARDLQVGLRLSLRDEDVLCACGPSLSVLLLSPLTLLTVPPQERAANAPKLPAAVWDALDVAVIRGAASGRSLVVISDEPVLDDGPLDAQARASLSPQSLYSWAYHVDECTRLLDLLFAWQVEQSGRVVTLLCGSEIGCSFRTSIFHERVDPKVAIAQYCLGPVAGTPRGNFVGKLPFLQSGYVDPALLAEDARLVKEPRYAYRHKIVGRNDNAFLVAMVGTRRKSAAYHFDARVVDAGELVGIVKKAAQNLAKRRLTMKSLRSASGRGLADNDEGDEDDDEDDDLEDEDGDLEDEDGDVMHGAAKMPGILTREPTASWMMGVLAGGEKAKSGRLEEAKIRHARMQELERLQSTESAIKRAYPDLAFPEQPWDTPREDVEGKDKAEVSADVAKTGKSALPEDAFRWLDFDMHFYGPRAFDELLKWYRIMEDIDKSPTGAALQASFTKFARQDVGVTRRQACKLFRDFFLLEAPAEVGAICFSSTAILPSARANVIDAAVLAILKRQTDVDDRISKSFPYGLVVPLLGSVGAALVMAKTLCEQQAPKVDNEEQAGH